VAAEGGLLTRRLEAGCCALLALLPWLLQLRLLGVRNYDPDELQHVHGAYSIANGLLPYRDYFEHHTPLLPLLLAPLTRLFAVETSSGQALAFLTFARGLMWVVTGMVLMLAFRLARPLFGLRAAWLAVALLANCWLFFDKTLEIRPDVPACALLVAALLLLARALRARVGMDYVSAGLAFGLGLMFTQKLVLVLVGLLPGLWLAGAPLLAFAAFGFGCAIPVAAVLLYFALRGGLLAFVECNLLVNLRWQAGFAPGAILRDELLAPNSGLAFFAVLGLALALRRPRAASGAVALAGLGGFAGLWLVQVPWQQYYLTFLPVAALLGGFALASASERLAARRVAPQLLALPVLLLACAQPLPLLRAQLGRSNADKQASIRFVIENTAPGESVLDGYTGVGVFRPHAWRFFFLHAELRQMLSDAERRELLLGLQRGTIAPRLLSFDGHSSRVSPEVTALFEREYAPVGQGPLWARVFPPSAVAWDDAAPRPLARPERPATGAHVLVGTGWDETEQEAGVRFRRSRGRVSLLHLPLRDPRAARLVLRARAGSDVAGLGFEAWLNDVRLGGAVPAAGWGEHLFDVPPELLRSGLNRLTLRYPRTPNQARPDRRGPNAVLALESLRLER
jgi:hypothetical protein